jgi:hypothetical protein
MESPATSPRQGLLIYGQSLTFDTVGDFIGHCADLGGVAGTDVEFVISLRFAHPAQGLHVDITKDPAFEERRDAVQVMGAPVNSQAEFAPIGSLDQDLLAGFHTEVRHRGAFQQYLAFLRRPDTI